MIDHVTIHVPPGTLAEPGLTAFFGLLEMEEIPTDDPFEHGWKVRWFRPLEKGPNIHLVEGIAEPRCFVRQWPAMPLTDRDIPMLGHFCVVLPASGFEAVKESVWLTRDSGSGRIWMEFANIRVEVR